MLEMVASGLRLAEAFTYSPRPILPQRQIEAIFGPEQLRNSELFLAFATHLSGFVKASTLEESKTFMERLILEDKLWEQLETSLPRYLDSQVPFSDKLQIIMAFYDVIDVAFESLKDSSIVDWKSPYLDKLIRLLKQFLSDVAPHEVVGRVFDFRSEFCRIQISYALLTQFALRRSDPLATNSFPALKRLSEGIGLGQLDQNYMSSGNADGTPDQTIEADVMLTKIISNGPLSIFCNLGRMSFEALLFEVSDLTESIEKAWKLLERTLDSPHLPLVNASGEMWVEFDRLRDKVRHTVVAKERSFQNAEKLRTLLDMIERVDRMHPPADARTEVEGNGDNQTRADGSPNQDARPPGGVPIIGSSKEVEMSRLETEGHMDARHFSPNLSTIPQAGTDRLTSHQVMVSSSSLDPTNLQAQASRSMNSGLLETPDFKARDSKYLFTCFYRR